MVNSDLLDKLIAVTVGAIVLLAISWWSACTFYIGPKLFQMAQQAPAGFCEPDVCKDVDSKAIAVMTGVLATLIALKKKDA